MFITPHVEKMHTDTLTNGGATVDLTRHHMAEPEGRYYYGGGSWAHTVPVDFFTPAYLAALVLVAKREGHPALGTWVDEGIVYVEPTTVEDNRTIAYMQAAERGEKAFYDSLTGETIRLT